jgi:hypothetical protein
MSMVMAALSRVVNGLLLPFGHLPPLVGLAAVSLAAAIGILMAMRATSDQARLITARRSLRACVYELRLYRDDLPTMGRIVGEGVRANLAALRLAMVPTLWLIVPFALVASQLQGIYGYSGLEVGQPAVITVRLKDAPAANRERPRLVTSPPGLRVETSAVWVPSLREASWRIAADRAGDYDATVEYRGDFTVKHVTVSGAAVARSPVRGSGILSQLLHPSEPVLPAASAIESIAVTYPEGSVEAFGQHVHWSVAFFGLSSVFVLALRRRFGVTL